MNSNYVEYSIKNAVRFFGRTAEISGQNGIYFNSSGAGFVFKFKGTSACAQLTTGIITDEVPRREEMAYIGIFVDDIPFSVSRFPLDRKSDWYTLVEGLPFGEHIIKVVKETELGNGRAAVTAIKCDGELLNPPSEKKLKLEFIGDSITCGYGNICSNASPEFVTGEEEFSKTYASLTATLLNAEISTVAASGNGFYHDYGCNTHNLIPTLYLYNDKMLYDHCGIEPKAWDFENDARDAVIIKLGQNDGQYCSGADLKPEERLPEVIAERRACFEEKAVEFLTRITELRPNTPVILIVDAEMFLKNELISASKRVKGISLLEIESKHEYEGVGANGHWSVYTHARVAHQLSAFIRKVLCLQ